MGDRRGEYPNDVDPDESPFAIPPIEGLPFGKDSEEARAIREILRGEADPDESPFAIPPLAGRRLRKDPEEARAIREIIAQAEGEPEPAGRRSSLRVFRRARS